MNTNEMKYQLENLATMVCTASTGTSNDHIMNGKLLRELESLGVYRICACQGVWQGEAEESFAMNMNSVPLSEWRKIISTVLCKYGQDSVMLIVNGTASFVSVALDGWLEQSPLHSLKIQTDSFPKGTDCTRLYLPDGVLNIKAVEHGKR